MTTWIDFAVYAALVVTIWVISPLGDRKLLVQLLIDRNPQWARLHPEQVRKAENAVWIFWLAAIGGAVFLAGLVAIQLGQWSPETAPGFLEPTKWSRMAGLAISSLLLRIIVVAGLALFVRFRFSPGRIPLRERRSATLVRRRLDDFVPRWLQYTYYALAALCIAAWFAVWALQLRVDAFLSAAAFRQNFAFYALAIVATSFSAHFMVIRRPSVFDRIYGPAFRRDMVHCFFAVQFAPILMAALVLNGAVNGTLPDGLSRFIYLCAALAITYAMTWTIRLQPQAPPVPLPA